MKQVNIKISDLFDAIENYEKTSINNDIEYFQNSSIQILNEFNEWIDIIGFIKKCSEIVTIHFHNSTILRAANTHLLSYDKIHCKKMTEYIVGDSVILADDSVVTVESIEYDPVDQVYDLQVDSSTSLYQTANKLIHHNTLLACQIALDLFFNRKIEKIIITRPNVASAEDIGHLPGSMKEKMDPWLAPIYANLYMLYNKVAVDKMVENQDIEISPFAFIRGRTFVNACVIVDEAQNVNSNQTEMIIGRLGIDSKMIFCGDTEIGRAHV